MNLNDKPTTLVQTIGHTPMIPLDKFFHNSPVRVFAKVESYNPGHSMKDRVARHIIEEAEKDGRLKPGATIVETTSGNTGYSIAMLCALKGYRCILAVNSKCAAEKLQVLRAMGAEVHVCPANVPPTHPESYYSTGARLAKENPGSIYVNQYFNPKNSESYYLSAGPEIWEQTEGKITHFFACSGTGGTVSGIGRYLKEKNPNIEVIGVDAVGSILKKYKETGIIDPNELQPYRMEGVGKNMIPSATDFSVIDRFVKVNDYESALVARLLPQIEGLMCGYSSGSALSAVIKEVFKLPKNAVPVVLLPDHGERYMSKIFDDKWMESQQWLNDVTPEVKAQLNYLKAEYLVFRSVETIK
ncbi:MAG: cysteine synthase family protein [Flavobacteriales bacterium]|nr:cysteine synthase family protein [Flavobacteriales bacterium]